MKLGLSQVDITPHPGVELSGFAARQQPSVSVLDPLFAKALYLTEGNTRLLWIHCDLIGFDRPIVADFRRWASEHLGLHEGQVLLSATHTHSGPCTIRLQEAGQYDPHYVEQLHRHLRAVAQAALVQTEPVRAVPVEGRLALSVDRRRTVSAHTDPRVAAVGLVRADGSFAAVVVNYSMHPVALGPTNRQISADYPGQTAKILAQRLPGNPVVLTTNGACANLNPPAENVPFSQIYAWGEQVAEAVIPLLQQGSPVAAAGLKVASRVVPLPLDTLDADGINAFADKALQDQKALAEWNDKYRRVVENWRTSLLAQDRAGGRNAHRDAELFAISIGDVLLLGINAEVFSEFTDWIRASRPQRVYLVGYANGDMGYLPTRAAYDEGGYEVDVAHLFYGGFRPRPGGLELLAQQANELIQQV